jgi:hypothetical protein
VRDSIEGQIILSLDKPLLFKLSVQNKVDGEMIGDPKLEKWVLWVEGEGI